MKNYFRSILAFVLSICILATFCAVPMVASADSTALKFNNDHKFKIVIFSDVQDQFPVHQRVINIMRQALTRENPDLIVYLGDITEQNIKDPEVDYRRTVEQIFSPAVEAGIPYAVVFGNHDDQSYYSGTRTDKAAMLSVIQSLGDCRTVDADPELFGTGTCKIPIYSSDGSSVAFDLFMVDSNTYRTPTDGSSGYDNPHADQVAWLAANKDAGVNSMVFQHIPMPEIYNLLKEDANGSKTYGDKKYAKELNGNASGYLGEFPNPTYASNNMGEFETLKEMGGVLNVFTGHDHLNDFTGTYDGISMTAVPGMTYYNYGKEEVRGYGVIELNESDTANYDYHSVKFSTLDAEAGGTQETTYADYDVITYADLRKDGNPLPETDYNIHGSNTFTYEGTSPTHSAILKFRWTAGADNVGFQFSFDEGENGNIAYPFGVWIKRPNQASAGSYGAWHLRPNQADCLVNMSKAIKQGDVYDIELGKLKILTGEPQHVGEYYLYLKVNGVLIQEAYSNASDDGQFMSGNALCQMKNEIRFGDWSTNDDNNRISAYAFEKFAPYDVIEYEDLLDTGDHPLAAEGTTLTAQNNLFHYEATSPSHSAIYKLRWTAGDDIYFQLHPGVYGGSNNFAYRINGTNFNQRNPSADVPIGYTINEGDYVDIEIGRLLVSEGDNAGKYYTYFKAGRKVIFEKYVSADDTNTANYLADSIQLNLRDSAHFCEIGPIIAEVEEEPADALYYKYDEIEYGDLLLGGNYLGGETSIDGGKTFTYNKTSSTGSVILKYRWTAAEDAQFQLSFDTGKDGKVNYMFGVQLYNPGSEGRENSSIRLRPGLDDKNAWVDLAENIVGGQSYDVEFARLKVKNGDNAGKYYVYFKLNDELISESYVAEGVVDSKGNYTSNPGSTACTISNEIYMTAWGNSGNKISSVPGETAYYDYDEVYYGDLLYNDKPLAMETVMNGGRIFTYNKTSPTGSVILRYRWTAVEGAKSQISFDTGKDNKINYMFGAQLYTPGSEGHEKSSIRLRPGYDDKNAWNDLAENIVDGQNYDIEFARLKVKGGDNAGKYYVYYKINGELISESYVASNVVDGDGNYKSSPGDTDCKISNKIYLTFWEASGNKISATPFPETYEAYDEIYYSDLLNSGKPLAVGGTKLSGGTTFTYNRTSPTGSAILRYRWTVGSVAKFQLSFEKTKDKNSSNAISYMFGAWLSEPSAQAAYPNGKMWLRPGYGPEIAFENAIEPGSDHDIEFARLKVANGPNKGKYYVYIKIDGALIAEDYVAAGIVDENLNYYTKPNEDLQCSMTSNEIFLAFWGTENNYISAIPFEETYETYDEIYYSDLLNGGKALPTGGSKLSGGTSFTYNRTSPTGSAILRYRWTVGSVAKFQLSFERTKDKNSSNAISYMFGAWLSEPGAESGYDNGRMLLRPGYGSAVAIENVIEPNSDHDIEFARLKVANGP
ncbi:MAG: metallophosphoesterase, partial [Clostridia bacterium]|nr:metallophosphoesterase [Clostridia bacterium]